MQQLARRLGIATGGNAEYLTDAQRVALESIDVANDIDGEVVTVGDRPQRIAGANLILLPVDQLLGLHQGEVGCQHLGFLHGYEQLLRAVQGDPPGERRVQLVELVLVEVGEFGDACQVHALLERDDFEIGFVGDRVEIDAIGFRCLDQLRQRQQLGHIVAGFLRQRQVPVIGGQAQLLVALDGAADGAFACVVGRQCQQPVTVEQPMQIAQIAQGRIGRGGDVAAAVVPAGLAQVEVPAGGWNELPEPDRVRRRVGEGVIGAFDDR